MTCDWCGKSEEQMAYFAGTDLCLCEDDLRTLDLMIEVVEVLCDVCAQPVRALMARHESSDSPAVLSRRFWAAVTCRLDRTPFDQTIAELVSIKRAYSLPFVPSEN